jgi:probable addiction module antidote protein
MQTKTPDRSGPPQTRPYDVAEQLRKEEEMAAYLDAWLMDAPEDTAGIARALADIAHARGMTQMAEAAGLSSEALAGDPASTGELSVATLLKVVDALGVRLHVEAAAANLLAKHS